MKNCKLRAKEIIICIYIYNGLEGINELNKLHFNVDHHSKIIISNSSPVCVVHVSSSSSFF